MISDLRRIGINLFITLDLFYDTVISSSECIVSSGRLINEWWIGNDTEGSMCHLI
jgi:hypothetical protein